MTAENTQTERKNVRRHLVGIVLSDKMQKTIVVQTRRKAPHPLYGKVIEKAAKFKVHDEKNEARTGDRVRIAETRPLSKDKRWRLVEIIERGSVSGSVREMKQAAAAERSAS